MLRILDITGPDILQGLGIRCSLWVSGCKHHCPNCQNCWTWDYNQGKVYSIEKEYILDTIKMYLEKPYYKGITLSGGDPLFQDEDGLKELIEIIEYVKKEFPTKDIWLYTGFLWEEIKYIPEIADIDVICEGKFVKELLDNKKHWVGSTNQRVVDVKASLENNKVVLHE